MQNSPHTNHDLNRLDAALDSRYWKWIFTDPTACPPTLSACFRENLSHIHADSWPERFYWGGVYLNGRLQDCDCAVETPCKIEYYEPKLPIAVAHELFPRLTTENIVYQDEDLIVVFKPTRLPTMPAKEQRHFSAKSEVEKLLGVTTHIPSRLDMSVCGLVPMSVSPRMHPLLQNVFESRSVIKTYVLATRNRPAWNSTTCIGSIGRSPVHPILREVVAVGGQKSVTRFSVLDIPSSENPGGNTFLEVQPVTGRTHQIRVHSGFMNCPIVGDNFYGGFPSSQLHLCCARLSFTHPLTNRTMDVGLPKNLSPKWLPPAVLERLCTADPTGL